MHDDSAATDASAAATQMSDERAFQMLSRILDARKRAAESSGISAYLAHRAVMDARELAEGTTGWAVSLLDSGPRFPMDEKPVQRRASFAITLRHTPLIPPRDRLEFSEALFALNGGQTNPLLTREKPRRGARPHDRTIAEEQLLFWIARQVGLGRTQHLVEREAANAICREPPVFDQWRHQRRHRGMPKRQMSNRFVCGLAANIHAAREIGKAHRSLLDSGVRPEDLPTADAIDLENAPFFPGELGLRHNDGSWITLQELAAAFRQAVDHRTT